MAQVSSFKSAPDDYIGRIEVNSIAPPYTVADVVEAIAIQEGCHDAFISADYTLHSQTVPAGGGRPVQTALAPETLPVSPGVALKIATCLMLIFKGVKVSFEREANLVGALRSVVAHMPWKADYQQCWQIQLCRRADIPSMAKDTSGVEIDRILIYHLHYVFISVMTIFIMVALERSVESCTSTSE